MSAVAPLNDPMRVLAHSIRETAARPLAEARALPAAAYVSEAWFEQERLHLLQGAWQSVAHVSQIPSPGDYVNLELQGERISVIRGEDGVVRVLSRICAHRGMDVMPPESGHAEAGNCKHLQCPYHHWVYGLDGRLKGAPLMKTHAAVAAGDLALKAFRSEVWQGFVFVTFDESAPPVAEAFAGLMPHLERFRMHELEMVLDVSWDCPFNWKVLVENFMEPYHHLGAHHSIFQPIMPAQGCWTEPVQGDGVVCHLPLADELQRKVKAGEPQLLSFPVLPGMQPADFLEWTVFLGAPHFLLFTAPDRVYWYRIEALSAGRMRLHTTLMVDKSARSVPGFEAVLAQEEDMLRRFHLEDMEVCGAVQVGLRSQAYQPGPLAELEAPIWQFQRWIARRLEAAGF